MRSEVIGLAQMAVRQQVEIFGGDQVSLNSLWRAVGNPDGQDPARWAEVAGPLLAGFLAYFERLESLGGVDAGAGGSRLLWTWEDESKDPWCTGDLMSHELVALVYASHLDSRRMRRSNGRAASLAVS